METVAIGNIKRVLGSVRHDGALIKARACLASMLRDVLVLNNREVAGISSGLR